MTNTADQFGSRRGSMAYKMNQVLRRTKRPLTSRDVAARAHVPVADASAHLSWLHQRGQVERKKQGRNFVYWISRG